MGEISIKNETTITVGLVIVFAAAAFSIGGMYMKVDDTAVRQMEFSERMTRFEEKQNQMATDIAAIKQSLGVATISSSDLEDLTLASK